tara:strand:- start:3383 stop:3697 length:315 start_codon:yes stop_codon:yes gene_type:complete
MVSEKEQVQNNERNRRWNKTPKGRLCHNKKQWKKRGLDMDTFYYVYPIYLTSTNCERCGILFSGKNDGGGKCMDHCKTTGIFRNIICRNCNVNVIPHINKKLFK